MATKKFLLVVEEGVTHCDGCPIYTEFGYCNGGIYILDCYKYNLATMKIKTEEGIKKEMIREAVKWMYNYLVIKHSIMSSAGFGVFEQEFIKELEENESKS